MAYSKERAVANNADPNFVANGSITLHNSPEINDNSDSAFQTMSVLMVPIGDVGRFSEILKNNNINVIDQYNFKDLRETGEGGMNQTLLVLGTNNPLEVTIAVLKKITLALSYS